jgi:hypothetical protein
MDQLRWFIRDQLDAAQASLGRILLVGSSDPDDRVDVLPPLCLSGLEDGPAIETVGWSFLDDPCNADQLQGYDRWLLNRIRDNRTLRKRFTHKLANAKWSKVAVQDYLIEVDGFLERLRLLIHLTSSQPSRATKLLTLQWRNSTNGL